MKFQVSLYLIYVLLYCFLTSSEEEFAPDVAISKEEIESGTKVTINKKEHCEGCKELVSLYAHLLNKKMHEMHLSGKKARSTLDGNALLELICDNERFDVLSENMKYACMKVLEANKEKNMFLLNFDGASTAAQVISKRYLFERKREICTVATTACHHASFDIANVTKEKRTQCRACNIVAQEVEKTHSKIRDKSSKGLRTFLEDELCLELGYNYHPYGWLENTCDEMMEEHIDNVLEVVNFHRRIAGAMSSLNSEPDESMPDMLCKEIYKCKPQTDELRREAIDNLMRLRSQELNKEGDKEGAKRMAPHPEDLEL